MMVTVNFLSEELEVSSHPVLWGGVFVGLDLLTLVYLHLVCNCASVVTSGEGLISEPYL